MKLIDPPSLATLAPNRRSFLRHAVGATAAVATLGVTSKSLFAATTKVTSAVDTPAEIFTAALIAEDLASTFYYNVLVGEVVQDPNLSGPGGTASNSSNGSPSNVGYIRAALSEEILHANLFRSLIGGTSPATDPYQTFYFKPAVFEDLNGFIGQLEALEGAFIGAYLAAIQQFALLAAEGKALTFNGTTYQPSDFAYYAKIAASILGVESEHRALGRAISPDIIPANQLAYEGTDGITTVYNGSSSAVVALLPFLTGSNQTKGYSLATALANQKKVSIPVGGTSIPAE
jgi:hypothetical protein